MKFPAWKKYLSYLFEIPLERDGSWLNPDLQLGLKKGRYCLSTPNAIYSYDDLYDNFSKSFQKMKIGSKPIKNVLVLGFGLGSIPYLLEKTFNLKCSYIGIEADELIALWASKYVTPTLKSPLQMVVTDALAYVDFCEDDFDLIAMDIFIDNHIPGEFETVEFLSSLKGLLSKDGILMYNRLALRQQDRENTANFFANPFKQIFPEASYFDVGGNWMLLNKPTT